MVNQGSCPRGGFFGGSWAKLASYRTANDGSIACLSRTGTVCVPVCVGEDQKVASKVSMSTKVSSPDWSEDPVGLSEKQPREAVDHARRVRWRPR
jgi:hypothetical protein